MDKKNNTKQDKWVSEHCTLGLADPDKIDEKTKATSPSTASVEQTREWSIENKL